MHNFQSRNALRLLALVAFIVTIVPSGWRFQAQTRSSGKPVKTITAPNATTDTTSLFTVTGSGGGTSFGDYVSSSAALDDSYRFFIEVPSGASQLSVDIFDADVGAGGTGEAAAGRDRNRSSFDSAVAYSLRDPSGSVVPVSFSTGNASGPTGADNAWLTLFNRTGKSVRDNFGTAAYSNNDGTDTFAGDWAETDGGGGGAAGGAIRITGGQLRIQDGVSGTPSIVREADLLGTPGLNFTSAFLSFDFSTSGTLENSDDMQIQVSGNGGGSWTTLENFSNDSSGSRQYDISGFIANNTRIRFIVDGGYDAADEFFFVDNLEINDGGAVAAGHWELQVDMSSSVTAGDDINALGIRAHDGAAGSTGTEMNIYVSGMAPLGVNNPTSGTNSRSYTLHPYVTSGCTCSKNDFDFDSDSGNIGSMAFTSRTGAFTQNFASANLSEDNSWSRGTVSGWTSDAAAGDYGIWTAGVTINSYFTGAQNANYGDLYLANFQAAANPPGANPVTNSFRIYLQTDSGGTPQKPYLVQSFGQASGPNPVGVGQTGTMRVRVAFTNPTPHAVTFSAANLVTANIPGAGATYAGTIFTTQGSIFTQPAIGGTGNLTWNPGTVAAGATVLLVYDVSVTPTSAGQRIPITATPASGNGTRARYVDETSNMSQAAATYTFGPICELAVTEGVMNAAPSASSVPVSGRVVTPDGRGLKNAVVHLTASTGEVRLARTGTFGYFEFESVPAGGTYFLTVRSKRYEYEPRVVTVDDAVAGLELAPSGANGNEN